LKKAFRGIPILGDHLDLTWVVWCFQGEFYVSQHYGMPFSTFSAVLSFHRFGSLLAAVLKRVGKCLVLRYVDDFFGASKEGVVFIGGVLLAVLAKLVGRPCDAK